MPEFTTRYEKKTVSSSQILNGLDIVNYFIHMANSIIANPDLIKFYQMIDLFINKIYENRHVSTSRMLIKV